MMPDERSRIPKTRNRNLSLPDEPRDDPSGKALRRNRGINFEIRIAPSPKLKSSLPTRRGDEKTMNPERAVPAEKRDEITRE